jgi:glycosyltransferase involved in cell wall biosynthesis
MAKHKQHILFIQHSGSFGGSVMSLLYTMQGLDPDRYEPTVALSRPSPKLRNFYRDAGFEVYEAPNIVNWHHSTVAPRPIHKPLTWKHLYHVATQWQQSKEATLELVKRARADLVHLNSMPLSSSALALSQTDIPVVWHVREPPSPASGPRYHAIREIMSRVDELIFISRADRMAWAKGTRGEVVHNFLDFSRFDKDIDQNQSRTQLQIDEHAPTILYVGGLIEQKGVLQLLEALRLLKPNYPDLQCLMPNSVVQPPKSWKSRLYRFAAPVVSNTLGPERIEARIHEYGLDDVCVRFGFRTDIEQFFAATDVLVFPCTVRHFARPAIEASAMEKPVVASDVPGMDELVDHGKTGILVPPKSTEQLAASLSNLLSDPELRRRMGRAGYRKARKEFEIGRQIQRIEKIYNRLLD